MKRIILLLFASTVILISCGESDDSIASTTPINQDSLEPKNPIQKGDRLLGVSISSSILGFQSDFAEVQKAGIDELELNIPWSSIETSEGVYTDPGGLLAAVDYYGQNGIKVSFSLAVINTVKWEVPAYLSSTAPNSPEFINAFNKMVDWFISEVPESVTVPSLSIGNEIDIVLNGTAAWQEYSEFYQAAKSHISTNYPEIKVGVKTTVIGGLFGDDKNEIININQFSDVIMLNHYPQNQAFQVKEPDAIFEDFDEILTLFPSKDIHITEIGYQSGENLCMSSELKQATFYHNMFTVWDTHKDRIKFMLINWLNDQSPEMINTWKDYYGDDPALVEYLSTLGLRNYDGTSKKAWDQVLKEANARGWK